MRRHRRDLVQVMEAPVERAVSVARPAESPAGQQPQLVVVQLPAEQSQQPVVAPGSGVHRPSAVMAGVAALIAAVGVLVWSCNPKAFEPAQPSSSSPSHVEKGRSR